MEVNVPAKVLRANVTSFILGDQWPFDDGLGDPFWSGGVTPKSYRWEITFNVSLQSHGSHLTREDKEYNGLDVFVGDYIAGSTTGTAVKIISIESKTETTVVAMVEDVLRYNTFRSASGNGLFTVPGTAVIFEVNEKGDPIVDPLPVGFVDSDFYGNLESRFKAFTLQENFLFEQIANGFVEGDSISVDGVSGLFELTESDSLDRVIGSVSSAGPGPDAFLLRPTTKIIEGHEPVLPGSAGDFIYSDLSTPGALTTSSTSNKRMFLQLTDAVSSEITGSVLNGTTTLTNVIVINGIPITFATGTGTIDDAVIDINGSTGLTGVVATKVFSPTSAETVLGDLAYGLVGNFLPSPGPADATINGTLVTFNDDTDGAIAFGLSVAIQSDMARVINAASIPNIVATFTASKLIITNTIGGSITIVLGNNDGGGDPATTPTEPFAGPSSGSGVPLITAASTDELLKLTRVDGGEILLQNSVGIPLTDFGLFSVQNGRVPIGLVIEAGIRKGELFVVADIAARDALTVLVGDQAFVIDKGDSEWGLFLWDGSIWVVTSTEESARTDSRSLSVDIIPGSSTTVFIGEVSGTSRVTPVTIDIITPFDGAPTIEVGDSGDTDRLFDDGSVDMSLAGKYVSTPTFIYPAGSDVDINVTFAAGGATVGLARVTITYS